MNGNLDVNARISVSAHHLKGFDALELLRGKADFQFNERITDRRTRTRIDIVHNDYLSPNILHLATSLEIYQIHYVYH
jgi:hypothetical protein